MINDIDSVSQARVFLLLKCFISVAMDNYPDCSLLASEAGSMGPGPRVRHAHEGWKTGLIRIFLT